jgi:hypothetical protein
MRIGRFLFPYSLALALLLPGVGREAHAVPSFARQTDLACNACHYVFPELNAFGREFKLNGYTLTARKTVDAKDHGRTTLALLPIAPVSVMLQASHTSIAEKQPGTQNDNVSLPQQLSLFLAGSLTPHVGAFIQVTYDDDSASVGMDNTDIRFAGNAKLGGSQVHYGVTFNNNPTVEDLWNSTPAWGFPYASSAVAPTPAAAALVDGGLAQEVAGLGGYGLFADHLYAGLTFYRSASQGGPDPPDGTAEDTIQGVAPYWRLAYQWQGSGQYLELGAYGLDTRLYPMGVAGPTDDYADYAFDVQYERQLGDDAVVVHGTWIDENQDLNATFAAAGSANPSNGLRTFRIDGTYHLKNTYGFTLGYFSTTGDDDGVLYGPAPVTGSRTGSPDSDGIIAQVQALPWMNTKLALQYVFYGKFNGSKNDYDGFGRDASDNDTLNVFLWFNF